MDPGDLFPILGREGRKITTLEEWRTFAPPAHREKHWKPGRSAMELARAWVTGRLPAEVKELLESSAITKGFIPECAWAEVRTPLDRLRGNTRNHDLVVLGRDGRELNLVLAVEGKADESFDKTIAKRLAEVKRQDKPSNLPKRISQLAQAVLRSKRNEIGELHYQLLFSAAATLIEARRHGAAKAVFLVQEFRSPALSEKKLLANAKALESFVRRLAGDPGLVVREGVLYGPYKVQGNEFVPRDVDLFVGKVSRTLL